MGGGPLGADDGAYFYKKKVGGKGWESKLTDGKKKNGMGRGRERGVLGRMAWILLLISQRWETLRLGLVNMICR